MLAKNSDLLGEENEQHPGQKEASRHGGGQCMQTLSTTNIY